MKGLIVGLLIIVGQIELYSAAGADSTSSAGASASIAKALSSEDRAAYGKLKRQECEMLTRFTLLTELAEAHGQKAEEAVQAEQETRADWEKELAQELHDKAAAVSKQLREATKQVLTFEQAHRITGAPEFPSSSSSTNNEPGPAEVAFLSLVNERLLQLQQEILAVVEAGNSYSAELQTNSTPEAMVRVSYLVQDNARQIRELEWEKTDLELRRFEFQAILNRMRR